MVDDQVRLERRDRAIRIELLAAVDSRGARRRHLDHDTRTPNDDVRLGDWCADDRDVGVVIPVASDLDAHVTREHVTRAGPGNLRQAHDYIDGDAAVPYCG